VTGRRPVVGLLVNPVAGVGGRVGLKGSDGAETVRRALALGASPMAGVRASDAIRALVAAWPGGAERMDSGAPLVEPGATGRCGASQGRGAPGGPECLAGPGEMGADAARAAGAQPGELGSIVAGSTTAADTIRLAGLMAERGVDLLLFAGGDGTARDIHTALGGAPVPVLGIPAGVKIHSAVFATGPVAAGEVAAAYLARSGDRRRTEPREVLDLDEAAYRRGEVAPRLWGELHVPVESRRVQSAKAPTPATEFAAASAIAAEVAGLLEPGMQCILGPGSTVRAIADGLGVPKTLVGVDIVEITASGSASLLVVDAAEADLLPVVAAGGCRIVVTPIGGQGFVFGRGNQQLSPAVIRAVLADTGRAGIVVVATPAKLAALGTRPLLVDTGDPALDRELAGHVIVITGRGDRSVARVVAA
jgi:predicted polyphosphate/ATP-dependent NAD kinase